MTKRLVILDCTERPWVRDKTNIMYRTLIFLCYYGVRSLVRTLPLFRISLKLFTSQAKDSFIVRFIHIHMGTARSVGRFIDFSIGFEM